MKHVVGDEAIAKDIISEVDTDNVNCLFLSFWYFIFSV